MLTSVDLDHLDYLGATREDIGREKAGVFRRGPSGDLRGSRSAAQRPRARRARSARSCCAPGATTARSRRRTQWRYFGPGGARFGLPHPALRGDSSARQRGHRDRRTRVPARPPRVPTSAIREGLTRVELPGSLHGAARTADDRARRRAQSACRAHARVVPRVDGLPSGDDAVVGMLADKDIDGVIAALRARIDRWHVASLPGPRGASRGRSFATGCIARGVSADVDSRRSPTSSGLRSGDGRRG